MAPKINYSLAAWSGKRREIDHCGGYLDEHLDLLNRLKHNLAQVTIAHPFNPEESQEYTKKLFNLKKLKNGIPIVVLDQPNIGISYGHWSRTFGKYRSSFDYYIFIEDDYVPVVDHFDQLLVTLYDNFRRIRNCGYLCSLFFDGNGSYCTWPIPPHAGISNGISSSDVLEQVWQKFGMLPHDTHENYNSGQVLFSSGFLECGFEIMDYVTMYRSLYHFNRTDKLRWYSFDGKQCKDILAPIQYALNPVKWEFELFTYDSRLPGNKKYRFSTITDSGSIPFV